MGRLDKAALAIKEARALITKADAARVLGISRPRVIQLIAAGQFPDPAWQRECHALYDPAAIEAYKLVRRTKGGRPKGSGTTYVSHASVAITQAAERLDGRLARIEEMLERLLAAGAATCFEVETIDEWPTNAQGESDATAE